MIGYCPVSDTAAQPWAAPAFKTQRQQTDFTCGLAALANTLSRMGALRRTEAQLLQVGEQLGVSSDRARRSGYSMAQLAAIAEAEGFSATGLRLDLSGLAALKPPFIVRLETAGGAHFSTVINIVGDPAHDGSMTVTLADSSWGDVTLDMASFAALWLDAGMPESIGAATKGGAHSHQSSATGVALVLRRR